MFAANNWRNLAFASTASLQPSLASLPCKVNNYTNDWEDNDNSEHRMD
jgi:hypothetical protein